MARRWPLLGFAPVASSMIMAGYWHYQRDIVSPALITLIIATSGTILIRQFLGVRTNEHLMRDLTRQRAIVARQAYRDPLTELGNRKMFLDHATDALAGADDTITAIVLFDLDGFKEINDTYGHATGDELLRATAERLDANVRANDTVSRLGGDEFVVLLPRLIDEQIAETVANRILHDLSQPLVIGETVLTIPASAGITARKTAIDRPRNTAIEPRRASSERAPSIRSRCRSRKSRSAAR